MVGYRVATKRPVVSHFSEMIYANRYAEERRYKQIGLDTKYDLEEKWHVGCDISKRPGGGHVKIEKKLIFFSAFAGTKSHKEVEAEKSYTLLGSENRRAIVF